MGLYDDKIKARAAALPTPLPAPVTIAILFDVAIACISSRLFWIAAQAA